LKIKKSIKGGVYFHLHQGQKFGGDCDLALLIVCRAKPTLVSKCLLFFRGTKDGLPRGQAKGRKN